MYGIKWWWWEVEAFCVVLAVPTYIYGGFNFGCLECTTELR